MPPQRVMLIRHGEKPGGAWPGPGLPTSRGSRTTSHGAVNTVRNPVGMAASLSQSSQAFGRPLTITRVGEAIRRSAARFLSPIKSLAVCFGNHRSSVELSYLKEYHSKGVSF